MGTKLGLGIIDLTVTILFILWSNSRKETNDTAMEP